IIKSHSLASEEFIKPLSEAHQFFKDVQPIVRAHHEFINGTGYPDKKVGDEIPILARIVSVVDTYDAMAVTRTYRAGLTDDIIYAELKRCAGTQFDSQLATIFLNSHRFWKKSQASEETQHEILKKVG
ncbi:MAG: HD domain-containing protein, partial [Bdellovibrio sp.]|nr:HD domain-containing protein [Bdellovibrio sp.]